MAVQLISINRFILDATDVAARLDAISMDGDRAAIFPIVQRAKEDYAALVNRRDALPVDPADTAVLNILLDNLQARLKFFENRV